MRRRIDEEKKEVDMTLIALGAIAGVLLLAVVSLFEAGFHILDYGYCWAAIGAWIFSGIILTGAVYLLYLFRKAYRRQKGKENLEDIIV